MVVDKSVQQKVVRYLKHLGLSDEQTVAYLYLLQHGPSTVLALSRGIKTGRTKLYPLLEDLAAKQLVAIHERHYGTSYEAQPPETLDFLVAEKERKAENLRGNLPAVMHTLKALQLQAPTTSRVVEYSGVDGLKQMNFNLTKADGEFRVFELAGLDKHLGDHFANKLRQVYREKNFRTYDLTNNPNRANEPGVDLPLAQARYISPKVFKIQFETYTYNNCVSLLSYEADDIFGVEVYNDKLAAQQKQLFDLVWSQATAVTKTP
ncbi:MAG TPA: helix-turn-helix domain-containing protein [Candidatus Limnocylindrales bacterium]|nr:helix-turn-helix domain-containing protein [Candidatus Limnocylindrales bacterium]